MALEGEGIGEGGIVSRRDGGGAAAAIHRHHPSTAADSPTPSMMLWKKVQHCVVFGGSFITSAKEREHEVVEAAGAMSRPRQGAGGTTQ